MIEELDVEEEIKAGVNVSLRKNPLLDDGSLIPQVSARKASVKETLSLIKEETSGVDTSLLRLHLNLYEQKILDLLKMGYNVKVMDLGVLHIKLEGSVKSPSEVQGLSEWTVRFTPSAKTLEAVKALSVDAVSIPDKSPLIESVTDLARMEADGSVTAGQAVRISGKRLKLAEGEGNFIAFVPQDSKGRDVQDKSQWLLAEMDKVFKNAPSELCFFAPEGIESGSKYKIRVSSTFISTKITRKEPLCGNSEVITVL